MNTEIESQNRKVEGLPGLAVAARRIGALEERSFGELAKLSAPAAITGEWTQILAYRHTLASNLIKLSHVAQHSELTQFHSLNSSTSAAEHKLLATATQAGLSACAHAG